MTNVEFDHADLYADEAAVVAAFRKLIALLPPTGTLVACVDSPNVRQLAAEAPLPRDHVCAGRCSRPRALGAAPG